MINIPAIKGVIGNTVYYIANFSFEQISSMVKPVDGELHTSKSLKEEIQRSLSSNYLKIKDYILTRRDHFFNSIVLAVYDGDPEWTEIRYELNNESFSNVGILHFNGEEKIFPVDGQHRVEGIKAALTKNKDIKDETISVILIGHSCTSEGMERSRRIFSTLNRYAKPVRLGDIIALDEDDVVAIVTRMQLESNPLFKGDRIKASNSKSIPVTDKRAFTTLMTLYECHLELFNLYQFNGKCNTSRLKDYLRVRPEDSVIEGFDSFLSDFWAELTNNFKELGDYVANSSSDAASEFRSSENGGNIFFRPVALYPFIAAICKIASDKMSKDTREIIKGFRNINRNVGADIWSKILWNPNLKKMVMRNQSVTKSLFIYLYDKSILAVKETNDLISKVAALRNIDKATAEYSLDSYEAIFKNDSESN